nr:uncharacterized protein LOC128701792 [Cherax quadricarinatus]
MDQHNGSLTRQLPASAVMDNHDYDVAVTSQPSNESELQLYRVLQRANLLNYYDTFISQGGDDVQQLCEAGEEEFLEIMALVGMASKPLHVRRLQKALQEWVSNPGEYPFSPAFRSFVSSLTGHYSRSSGWCAALHRLVRDQASFAHHIPARKHRASSSQDAAARIYAGFGDQSLAGSYGISGPLNDASSGP